jgi:hypothetical protein
MPVHSGLLLVCPTFRQSVNGRRPRTIYIAARRAREPVPGPVSEKPTHRHEYRNVIQEQGAGTEVAPRSRSLLGLPPPAHTFG